MIKNIVKHWDSLQEAVKTASDAKGAAWGIKERSSRKDGDSDFFGTPTFAHAAALSREGWPEGLQAMVKGVEALAAAPSLARGPAFTLGVAGAYPVASFAAAGDPACMIDLAPVSERARPIIRLAVAAAFSWRYTPKEVLNYGAGLVGIIDALEAADFRVEVNAVFKAQCSNGSERMLFTVKIKDSGDAVDLDRLAFCLCHAAFFRRIGFGLMESCLTGDLWSSGYGSALTLEEKDLPDMVRLSGVMAFGHDSAELKTPEAAFKAMIPLMSAQLVDRYADMPPLKY